jgi:hypothetical protein
MTTLPTPLEQKEFLIVYEMPLWYEFISVRWIQNLLARMIAFKINRKLARYNERVERKKWLKEKGLI